MKQKGHTPKVASCESLAQIIDSDKLTTFNPKRVAVEVFNFTKTHGSSQLEAMLDKNIVARHIKAKMNEANSRLIAEGISIRFKEENAYFEQTCKMYKVVPEIIKLYENVQRYASYNEDALALWIQLESALTIREILEEHDTDILEYSGIEEIKFIEKLDLQDGLIKAYADRLSDMEQRQIKKAHQWVDRFDRRLDREMALPFMLDNKIIENAGEYSNYDKFPINVRLKQALLEIGARQGANSGKV